MRRFAAAGSIKTISTDKVKNRKNERPNYFNFWNARNDDVTLSKTTLSIAAFRIAIENVAFSITTKC
jgi:hypothetical protein